MSDDAGQILRYLRYFATKDNWNFPEKKRYVLLIYPKKEVESFKNLQVILMIISIVMMRVTPFGVKFNISE